ncbi:hypothetical protein PHPALM_29724, partial [Phytophthora palmivora]
MDKYDLILGMPWLEKHEPWIDWRSKAIGANRSAVSDRALVSNVPTSVRNWGARDGRRGAYAPEEVLGVTDSSEDVAMSLATGHETKAHCQACGIATTASQNAESRRAVRKQLRLLGDVLLNNMSGCTLYSALDLVDGYYQILMRESDIPLTAVSTPSGMLWEWLVMPQGLSNAPATFNRLVTQLFRPLRTLAQTYFDDIFVRSRAKGSQTAMEVHLRHLRRVFEVIRANKLYANIDKCVFAPEEIKVLGCFVSRVGVRADPGKVKAIAAWTTPWSPKDLRKWLGLANYLHKYSAGYAELARPLSDLLKKDADWVWERQQQDAFDSIKASLQQAPFLALPDENKRTIKDTKISFQSRQLKAAERNYPVHDKELLAMKYALVKFRVHLLGTRPFVIYTDHASLRTATNPPHLSQRMARWLSFFAEYNFRVEYKPGKLNVLANALLRRPDYRLTYVSRATTDLYDRIRLAYQDDENYTSLVRFLSDGKDTKVDRLSPRQRAQLHCYELADGSLHYRVDPGDPPRVVVPNHEDLKYDILLEAHDVPSKMVHLAPVRDKVTGKQAAQLFLDSVFRYHGLPETIVSDRDPCFTGAFWDTLFQLLGTKLTMSTADHPQTDGQTERVNRVLEDTLRSICAEATRSWSDQLPMVEFALNNAVHASTGFTPFYLNGFRHPQVPLTLRGGTVASIVTGGEARKDFSSQISEIEP